MRHLRAGHVQVVGQGHRLVKGRARQVWQEKGRHSEQDGRRLSGCAQQPQDDAGDDPGERLGQHNVANALPARPAQAGADGAKLGRYHAQCFLGRADDDGQGHDRQRQRASHDRGPELEK